MTKDTTDPFSATRLKAWPKPIEGSERQPEVVEKRADKPESKKKK